MESFPSSCTGAHIKTREPSQKRSTTKTDRELCPVSEHSERFCGITPEVHPERVLLAGYSAVLNSDHKWQQRYRPDCTIW